MISSLKGLMVQWSYTRSITLKFLSGLNDDDLDKILPRKKLNTIRLQIEELAVIQGNYVEALKTRRIYFGGSIQDTSKQGLSKTMTELDEELEKYLDSFEGIETINWHGNPMDIHTHISAMIGHEQMHIGQIIGFCYATGIHIPDDITNMIPLNG